jgi:superfamily II DNA helicase RecQ
LSLLKQQGAVREMQGGNLLLLRPDLSAEALTAVAEQYTARAKSDRDKLEQMMLYGQSPECRWKILLSYFGETLEGDRFGVCDNCRHPIEERLRTPSQEVA